jgi:hypothetical protein
MKALVAGKTDHFQWEAFSEFGNDAALGIPVGSKTFAVRLPHYIMTKIDISVTPTHVAALQVSGANVLAVGKITFAPLRARFYITGLAMVRRKVKKGVGFVQFPQNIGSGLRYGGGPVHEVLDRPALGKFRNKLGFDLCSLFGNLIGSKLGFVTVNPIHYTPNFPGLLGPSFNIVPRLFHKFTRILGVHTRQLA